MKIFVRIILPCLLLFALNSSCVTDTGNTKQEAVAENEVIFYREAYREYGWREYDKDSVRFKRPMQIILDFYPVEYKLWATGLLITRFDRHTPGEGRELLFQQALTKEQRQEFEWVMKQVVERARTTANTPLGIPTSSNYVATVLDIDNGYSTIVNMDYFSVNVARLPVINHQQMTPEDLLYKMRMNLNTLATTQTGFIMAEFYPLVYGSMDDRNLWKSTDPLGAVVDIDIFGPDNGSVVVSKYSPQSWTFTTIRDPKNGIHPVAGNREFGFENNSDGSYTFFIKGVDRITDPFVTLGNYFSSAPGIGNDGLPLEFADLLWEQIQNGMADYINRSGGKASVVAPTHLRPDWVKVKAVRNGKAPLNTLSNDCK